MLPTKDNGHNSSPDLYHIVRKGREPHAHACWPRVAQMKDWGRKEATPLARESSHLVRLPLPSPLPWIPKSEFRTVFVGHCENVSLLKIARAVFQMGRVGCEWTVQDRIFRKYSYLEKKKNTLHSWNLCKMKLKTLEHHVCTWYIYTVPNFRKLGYKSNMWPPYTHTHTHWFQIYLSLGELFASSVAIIYCSSPQLCSH